MRTLLAVLLIPLAACGAAPLTPAQDAADALDFSPEGAVKRELVWRQFNDFPGECRYPCLAIIR